MRLEIGEVDIKDIQFSDRTEIKNGILIINKRELVDYVYDPRFAEINVEIARPGEQIRIIPVKDVIEPRFKVNGRGGIFPGIVSGAEMVGEGITHVLKGCTVVTTGRIVNFQEGLIDMCGPGGDYTPFSKTKNIVLVCEPVENLKPHDHERAIRELGLKASVYLGRASKDIKPDRVEVYQLDIFEDGRHENKELPRIVYVNTLLAQGLLHENFVYGINLRNILPTIIHPNEMMDGAIVSGNCVTAGSKNTTFDHLNNPIIEILYRRHNKELIFSGVIITPMTPTLADKKLFSSYAVKLAKFLAAEGLVIAMEGGGNPETDIMQICEKSEEAGIKTVLLLHEYIGKDGVSQISDFTPRADAIVTTGDLFETVTLPPVEKVIGHIEALEVLMGGPEQSLNPDGSITCSLAVIIGSCNSLGRSKLTVTDY